MSSKELTQQDSFGSTVAQNPKLKYDDTHQLLAMAVADQAIFGVKSVKQLRTLKIPHGAPSLELIWDESVKELPILRQANMDSGITDEPWTQCSFTRIMKPLQFKLAILKHPLCMQSEELLGR